MTFTRKGFVRTGVQGLLPGCLVDRDWDARSHLPAANRGRGGGAAVWRCFSCDLHHVAKFIACPPPSAPTALRPRTVAAAGLQHENPNVK